MKNDLVKAKSGKVYLAVAAIRLLAQPFVSVKS